MDEKTRRIADGLVSAMKAETEGHHFYRMAATTTRDEQGRRVFEQLAREELEHLEFLRRQYESVVESGKVDSTLELRRPAPLEGSSPIFSETLRGRIAEAHFEMTALSVGIQLELNAQRHYSEAAAAAEEPTVKRFYAELADWEAGHYQALLKQQAALKEDYWTAAGFAPY